MTSLSYNSNCLLICLKVEYIFVASSGNNPEDIKNLVGTNFTFTIASVFNIQSFFLLLPHGIGLS